MATSKKETKKEESVSGIAQPDKENSQDYIRENARKGESITDPLISKSMREGINVPLSEEKSEKGKEK